jgi:NADPH:quinone reductase-like Zn-dependent oxidoreductase
MLALRAQHKGGPESLALEDAPIPEPGTGDVLVEVTAAGYTPGELDWPTTWVDRSGHDRSTVIPFREVSGVVAKLGWGGAGFEVGDKVFGLLDWYRDGAAAGFVAVEARNLAAAPGSIDPTASAALPMSGLTALQGLFRHGHLKPGQRVLILGAGGAVGSAALQLAKSAGAVVLGVGREESSKRIMELGADEFLVIETGLSERVVPVDLVFDTVGESLANLTWRLIQPNGRLVSIASAIEPPVDRADVQTSFFVVEPDRHELAELAARVDARELHVPEHVVTPLEDARDTLIAKGRGEIRGKVVVQVGSTSQVRGRPTGHLR